jgi:hypothetical protein
MTDSIELSITFSSLFLFLLIILVGSEYAISTFGHGSHACPGKRFAISVVKVFTSLLFDKFALKPLFKKEDAKVLYYTIIEYTIRRTFLFPRLLRLKLEQWEDLLHL